MIFGIPIGILLITLQFYIPHALFVWFIFVSFKKWKQHGSFAWKAALISSIPAFAVLILMSLRPTYETLSGPPDPFFFIPLLVILLVALPVALGIFIIGWCLSVGIKAINAKVQKNQTDITKRQFALSIIIPTIVIISAALFFYRGSVIKKAESLKTSPKVLVELSNYPLLSVRRAVARNPSTPAEALKRLFEERNAAGYRMNAEALAKNPRTPPEILRTLYGELDKYFWLDYFIAQNPNTPEDILRVLASKPSSEQGGYIMGLASNPNLPKDLVDQLRKDESRDLRNAIKKVHGE